MLGLLADEAFHALEYRGVTYDCGDKLGLLRANLAFALKDRDDRPIADVDQGAAAARFSKMPAGRIAAMNAL